MAQISINSLKYEGHHIRIEKGNVFIDGTQIKCSENQKTINISIVGDVDQIQCDYAENFIVEGNVDDLYSISGDVKVTGNIGEINTTSGNVKCENKIEGSVNTVSGNVKASSISGNVKTISGDIKKS